MIYFSVDLVNDEYGQRQNKPRRQVANPSFNSLVLFCLHAYFYFEQITIACNTLFIINTYISSSIALLLSGINRSHFSAHPGCYCMVVYLLNNFNECWLLSICRYSEMNFGQ